MSKSKKSPQDLKKSLTENISRSALSQAQKSMGLTALEPRILLDAAAVVTGAEVFADALLQEQTEMALEHLMDTDSRQEVLNFDIAEFDLDLSAEDIRALSPTSPLGLLDNETEPNDSKSALFGDSDYNTIKGEDAQDLDNRLETVKIESAKDQSDLFQTIKLDGAQNDVNLLSTVKNAGEADGANIHIDPPVFDPNIVITEPEPRETDSADNPGDETRVTPASFLDSSARFESSTGQNAEPSALSAAAIGLDLNQSNLVGSVIPLDSLEIDTDGDGVADFTDIDDDNDGILDVDEGYVAPSPNLLTNNSFEQVGSGALTPGPFFGGGFNNFGGNVIGWDLVVGTADVYYPAGTTTTGGADVPAFSITNVTGGVEPGPSDGATYAALHSGDGLPDAPGELANGREVVIHNLDTELIAGTEYILTFDVFQADGLVGSGGTGGFEVYTIDTGAVQNNSTAWQDGTVVGGITANPGANGVNFVGLTEDITANGTPGSGTAANGVAGWQTITVSFTPTTNVDRIVFTPESGLHIYYGFDNLQLFQVSSATGVDSDGDGISDHLDIDSDNDGITDNIEAQTTAGYIAPNNDSLITLAGNRGLNSAYLTTNTGGGEGLAPVNTDAADPNSLGITTDASPDYLDTDSDGDGLLDTAEAGLTGAPLLDALSLPDNDADGDGLFDVFDAQNGTAADDGFDVNESIAAGAAALPDADNDAAGTVPLSADVDFRDSDDDRLDTDGDGVADVDDVDDDNDGILDIDEQNNPPILTRISSDEGLVNWTGDTDTTVTTDTSLIRRGTNFSRGGDGFVQADFTNPVPANEIVLSVVDMDRHRSGSNYTVTLVVTGDATTQDFILVDPAPGITYDPLTGIVNIPTSLTTSSNSNVSVTFVSTSHASVDSVRVSFAGGRSQDLVAINVSGAERFLDTDNDGIENHLDIDSDNDGITDNIEAQSTAGYIAPNADDVDTYRANNGLNSAYVAANGLTPVNSDGEDNADYLDTDSDNEGGNDTLEAGLGTDVATGLSDVTTDADGDGLFDVFDAQNGTDADDGFNVNESLAAGAAALPDGDNDAAIGVPLSEDVDFRDATINVPAGEAPVIDLDFLDDASIEPNESEGVIPLNITDPVDIVTDADGNTIQATYRAVAVVNGVTVDLVATLNSVEIIEPGSGNTPTTFEFGTTPFTTDQNDPNFGELNANNRLPGDFGRANVTYSLVNQATGNPVPLTFTVLFGDFDGNAANGNAERIIVNAGDIDAFILEDGTGGANDDDRPGTDIIVTEDVIDGETFITFAGGDNDPSPRIEDTGNAVQLVFSNTSSFTVTLERDNAGRNIGFNGSVSNVFGTPVIQDSNPDFQQVFVENDAPRNIAGNIVLVDDFGEDDLARAVISVDVVEFPEGTIDNLHIGDLVIPLNADFGPQNITVTLDNNNGNGNGSGNDGENGSDDNNGNDDKGFDVIIEFTAATGELTLTPASGTTIPAEVLSTLIQSVQFEAINESPDVHSFEIRVQVFDLAGQGSNIATSTIDIFPLNDAPEPTPSGGSDGRVVEVGTGRPQPSVALDAQGFEDVAALTGDEVREAINDGASANELGLIAVSDLLSDLDIDDFEQNNFGIGVTFANETNGRWQYLRLDVPGHEFTDFEVGDADNNNPRPVPDGEALLFNNQTVFRFVTDEGAVLTIDPEITFRVWDQTVGVASNPPSTIVDDSGGAPPNNTSSLSSTAFSALIGIDSDGDGVANSIDVDDDNDGILDVVEVNVPDNTTAQFVATWTHNDVPQTNNVSFINTDFAASADPVSTGPGLTQTLGNFPTQAALYSGVDSATLDDARVAGDYVEFTLTTAAAFPTTDSYFIDRIGQWIDTTTGTDALYYPYSFAVEVSGDGFATSTVIAQRTLDPDPGLFGDLSGNLQREYTDTLNQNVAFEVEPNTTYTFRVYLYDAQGTQSGEVVFDDFEIDFASAEIPANTGDGVLSGPDSDGDGLINSLDIDSDDDGITDNIEAQATGAYVAPSGIGDPDNGGTFVDLNRDGLDDNYDDRTVTATTAAATLGAGNGAGLTPVDTDSLGAADFLDPDSDDDGISDVDENGLGVTFAAGDTDGDGLADVYETAIDGNANDGFIVNEGADDILNTGNNYLPDIDGDAASGTPLTADLDFRDAIDDRPDTDGDGIQDFEDIDDDNDGILDVDEGFSITTPSAATGTLVFDTANLPDPNQTYTDIGGSGLEATLSHNSPASVSSQNFLGAEIWTLFATGGINGTSTVEIDLSANPASEVGFSILHINGNTTTGGDEVEIFAVTDNGTIITTPILTPQSATPSFTISGNVVSATGSSVADANLDVLFDASVIPPGEEIVSVTILWRDVGGTLASHGFGIRDLNIVEAIGSSAPIISERDSDGDGIADHLDIDSDNDGITDNIEAQTTAGYIAPSGVGDPDNGGTFIDLNRDGLDDNYDNTSAAGMTSGASGVGLSPVNTDAADVGGIDVINDMLADYLDTDSDGDGINDTVEAGLGMGPATGLSTAMTDADGDGLFDVFENQLTGDVNDGFNVNEDISPLDGTLPDIDSDAGGIPLLADLDFRDVRDDRNVDPVANPDVLSTDEDVTLNANILGNDTDADTGQTLSVTAATVDIDGDGMSEVLTLGTAALIEDVNGNPIGTLNLTATGALTFAPAVNYNGPVPVINYDISDGNGGTDSSSVTITVDPVNDAPVAVNDMVSGDEDTQISGDLTPGTMGQDSDAEMDILTVTQFTVDGQTIMVDPMSGGTAMLSQGTLTINADGSFTFDPAQDFNGNVPVVTYTLSDDNGGTDTADLAITVNAVNDAPIAMDDGPIAVTEDTPASGNVLGNDSDVDMDGLTVTQFIIDGQTIMVDPMNGGTAMLAGIGELTINADGSFTFTPALNYNGPVPSAVYTLSDGNGETDTAVLSFMNVDPVNDAPLAQDDSETTDENTALSDNVLLDNGNGVDSDVEGDSLTITAVNGEAANVGRQITLPSGALLTLNDDGTYDYDPNGQFANLADGESAIDSFSYEVSDGNGGTDIATVSITVNGINTAPSLDSDGDNNNDPNDNGGFETVYTENQIGATFIVDSDVTISDAEENIVEARITLNGLSGDQLGVDSSILNPLGISTSIIGGGTTTLAADGSLTIVLTSATPLTNAQWEQALRAIQFIADSDTPERPTEAPRTVDITLVDENGGASPSVQSVINVVEINDVPDLDLDDGNVGGVNAGNYQAVFTEDAGPVGITADVLINDLDDTDLVEAVVTFDNPQAQDQLFVDGVLVYDNGVLVETTGAVNGTIYTVQIDMAGRPIITFGGAASLSDYETFLESITFNNSSATPDETVREFGFVIMDRENVSSERRAMISITPVNSGPDAQANNVSVDADSLLSGNVITDIDLVNGADSDPEGDSLNVIEVDGVPASVDMQVMLASGALLTVNADGSYDYDPNGVFDSLAAGETALDSFSYTISDGNGGTDIALVNITIDGVNAPPQTVPPVNPGDPVIPNQSGVDGESFTALDLAPFFTDPDSSDVLTLSVDPADLPAGLTFDPMTGLLTGTPSADASQGGPNSDGVYFITVTADDGNGGMVSTQLELTITNPGPSAQDDGLTTTEDTASISANVITDDNGSGADSDPDGDNLLVTAVNGNAANVGMQITGSNGGLFTINADGSVTFETNDDFEGLDVGESETTTITYTLSDGQGGTDTATVTVTVEGQNDTPVIVDPTPGDPDVIPAQSGIDNAPITPLDVSPFFDDVDGQPLIFTASNLPSGLTIDPVSGVISGTPSADASQGGPNGDGVYNVTVTAIDTDGAMVTTTVTYSLTNPAPVVDSPVADQSVEDGEVVTITPSISDPDGDELTYSVSGLPAGLMIDPDTGEITGTVDNSASQGGPNGDGVYVVTITADDGQGGSVTDVIEITVTNPAPTAEVDVNTTAENSPVNGNVLGNDTDPDGDDLVVSAVNGDAANIGAAIAGDNGGLFTLNADGSYSFDPGTDFEGLDVGETATTTITYQVSDGEGGFDTATLTITVMGENDAPMVIDPNDPNNPNPSVPNQSGTDNAPLTPFDASEYFTDVDGEVNLFALEGAPSWLEIDIFTGVITGTPPRDASQGGPNSDGTYPVTLLVTDFDGAETRVTVNFVIGNLAPDAQNDDLSANEDGPAISGSLFADNGNGIDIDPDGDDIIISAVNGQASNLGQTIAGDNGGIFTVNPDGSYSFDANGDFEGLDVGETAITTLSYTISDGNGGFDTALVSVTIQGANDAPELVDPNDPNNPDPDPDALIPAQSGNDSEALTALDVSPFFTDVDGEALSYALDNAPSWLSIDPDTGEITGTPPADASQGGPNGDGVYVVTITATDPDGESVSAEVSFTLSNPAPTAQDDAEIISEDSLLSDTLFGDNGSGIDSDPDGDIITVTEINGMALVPGAPITLPSGAILTVNADGTYDYDPNGQFEGLDIGETALDSFTYQISDGEGGFDTATLTITVTGVNDAPVVDGSVLTAQTGRDGEPIAPLDTSAAFADIDGEDLSFTASNLPDGLMIDPDTGLITGTPSADASQGGPNGDGVYVVTITATDPDGAMVTTTVTYSLTNPAPVVDSPVADQAVVDGEVVTITPSISDPDGDELTYSADGLPAGLSIDPDTGEITGTVDNSASQGGPNGDGVYVVTITADDGQGGSVTDVIEITVTNPAPTAEVDVNTTAENSPVSGNVLGNDTDPDGDDLVVSAVNGDAANIGAAIAGDNGGQFTINADGSYSFDPGTDFEGLDVGETATTTITYQVSDGEGGFDTATLTITVTGVNDAPVVDGSVLTAQTGVDGEAVTPLDTSAAFADIDGEDLSFTASNLPDGLMIDPDTGLITGTPSADASQGGPNGDGVYVVTITATDPDGAMVTTTVTYSLTNPAPVVDSPVADQAVVDGEVVTITPSISDPDGDELTYSADGLPAGLSIDPDTGEITGTVDNSASQGGPNGDGVYVVTITADDGQGGSVTDVIEITVTNPAPVAENDLFETLEDTPMTVNLLANDSDPDDDAVSFIDTASLADGTLIPIGVATVIAEGVLTVHADGTIMFEPAPNFHGPLTFGYIISDGEGGSDVATVTINVTPVNDAPIPVDPSRPVVDPLDSPDPTDPDNPRAAPLDPNNYIPVQNAADGTPQAPFNLSPFFGDPDVGDVLTLSVDPADLPPGLMFDGTSITGTPTGEASQGGPNGDGVYIIAVTATDENGESFTTFVTYIVTNPAPVVDSPVADQSVQDGEVVTITPSISDPDGDELTYSADGLPAGLSIDPDTGEITGTVDNSASQGGPNGDGVYVVTITADDGQGGTVTDVIEFTVTNPPPDAVDDNPVSVTEDQPTDIDLLGNDTDPDGDDLVLTEINGEPVSPGDNITLPSGAQLVINSDGSVTYTPLENSNAPDSFTYSISDGEGGTDTADVFIEITPVNDAPSRTDVALPPRENSDGETIDPVDVSDAFADVDGDILTFTAENLPLGLEIDPVTGVISGTLDGSASVDGPYEVIITAIDPDGETISVSFIWTVENIAPDVTAPLTPEDFTTADEVNISVADVIDSPDGDNLTFSAQNLPAGLSLDPVTGVISGSPQEEGVFTVLITVDDGEGGVVELPLTLDILQNGFILPDDPTAPSGSQSLIEAFAGLEATPIALREFFAARSLAKDLFAELDSRRAGLEALDLSPYLGGVIAAKVPGIDDACSYLLVETQAMDHVINVQLMSPLEPLCGIAVTSWDVTLGNGQSLPDWIERAGDLLYIQRQSGQDNVQLRMRAVLDNGRTVTMRGDINLDTGQIAELGQASASLSSFADQLAAETAQFTPEQDELVKAFA